MVVGGGTMRRRRRPEKVVTGKEIGGAWLDALIGTDFFARLERSGGVFIMEDDMARFTRKLSYTSASLRELTLYYVDQKTQRRWH